MKKNIVILACKRLYRNTRIVRQARVLSERGYKVTVIALQSPCPELRAQKPDVDYIEIVLTPWVITATHFINRIMKFPQLFKKRFIRVYKNIIRLSRRTFLRLLCLLGFNKLYRQLIFLKRLKHPLKPFKKYAKNVIRFIFQNTKVLITCISALLAHLLFRTHDNKKNKFSFGLFYLLKKHLARYMLIARNFNFSKKTLKRLADMPVHLCQAHDIYTLPAAYKLHKKKKAKIIYDAIEIPQMEERSGYHKVSTPNWLRHLENYFYKKIICKSSLTLSVGPSLAHLTKEKYELENVVVIRNCRYYMLPQKNITLRNTIGLQPNERLILLIGSIYQNQGIEQLIQSVPYLEKRYHVALLGPEAEPYYIDRLHKKISELGIEQQFHILPPHPPESLLKFASGADIGVIPRQRIPRNNQLSLPNKVFEMIMARLPFGLGNLPDIADLVEHYNIGLLFDERNPKSIADALNSMLDDHTLFQLKKNVENAAKELCWEKESTIYVNEINKIMTI